MMKRKTMTIALMTCLAAASGLSFAQTSPGTPATPGTTAPPATRALTPEPMPRPAEAPADATALCADGKYDKQLSERLACARNRGIKEWYGPPAGGARGDKPAMPKGELPKGEMK